MIEYPLEKPDLWNGLAEIKDYTVKKAIRENKAIKVLFKGKSMILDVEKLKSPEYKHPTLQKSKFPDSPDYYLLGWRWKPDNL